MAAGSIGVIICGALATEVGLAAAALVALLIGLRRRTLRGLRVAAIIAVTAVCALGLVAIRGSDIYQFARYVGLARANTATHHRVQTYAQRTLMLYIGYRVWLAHPVFGAGWQSIRETQVYTPFLPAARARFPDQPPEAFPSPQHTWAIDNAYLQVLSDLGVVGFVLFGLVLVTSLVVGGRLALRGPPEQGELAFVGLLWVVIVIGLWTGQANIAGVPRDVLFWLGAGSIAAGRVSHAGGWRTLRTRASAATHRQA